MNLLHLHANLSHSLPRASFSLHRTRRKKHDHHHHSRSLIRRHTGTITHKRNVAVSNSALRCDEAENYCSSTISSSSGGVGEVGNEDFVEVMVVGSRKDALLDFCSASPFLNPNLRFWSIIGGGSDKVCLQQRLINQDSTLRTVDDFSAWKSSCKTVILIASAAYGRDHITALEILSKMMSGNGFVVSIILRPFSFEGQRRHDEVNDLVIKLKKQSNFCLVVNTDALLENDLVTLDEALRTSNNAVLMAMNSISVLLCEQQRKLLNSRDNSSRELQLSEFKKIFEAYTDAKIGFGAGHSVKISISRAIRDCPFLDVDIKGLDGVILCVIASSGVVEGTDMNSVVHTIRLISECKGDVIVSNVCEPSLEPKTILATLIIFGCTKQQEGTRKGIFSRLGRHFPFIFNIFKKPHQQTTNLEDTFSSENSSISDLVNSTPTDDTPDTNSFDSTTENMGVDGKFQPVLNDGDEEFSFDEKDGELLETTLNSSSYELNLEGSYTFKRELLARGNLGQVHATELADYGANFPEKSALVDSVGIYKLPVGVKYPDKFDETLVASNDKTPRHAGPSVSWSALMGTEFANNVSSFNKGGRTSASKKQGGLSSRAASMLESERDSEKKWTRVVEMKYRGGTYRGQIQGGLPEGKGRLLLGDGSIYEGMWRYGKRSGLGTFYFNNGDVYQGSWREDVMHGKGWLYFHTGDRWFANFWKGKANGEGRFYSKLGDVFFGYFREGWRHGTFLRISVDGTRSEELWDEGVLISGKQLDSDVDSA